MLNLTELEKAVEVIEKGYLTAKDADIHAAKKTLLDFARLALSLKEMPCDKQTDIELFRCGGCGECEACFHYQSIERLGERGYNQRGLEDKAWLTARLMGLEDIIFKAIRYTCAATTSWTTTCEKSCPATYPCGARKQAIEVVQTFREHFTGGK